MLVRAVEILSGIRGNKASDENRVETSSCLFVASLNGVRAKE